MQQINLWGGEDVGVREDEGIHGGIYPIYMIRLEGLVKSDKCHCIRFLEGFFWTEQFLKFKSVVKV